MIRISWLRCKQLVLIIFLVAIIVHIGSYYFGKRESENRALIKEFEQCYIEAFENYKYCVCPMFAANGAMALRLWRREMTRLLEQCNHIMKKHDLASGDIKKHVRDLIWAIDSFEIELKYCDSVDREKLLRMIKKLDREYGAFIKAAEGFECYVVRVAYCDEYK